MDLPEGLLGAIDVLVVTEHEAGADGDAGRMSAFLVDAVETTGTGTPALVRWRYTSRTALRGGGGCPRGHSAWCAAQSEKNGTLR